MGVVVVGYVPRPEGEAALERGIEEARLRGARLVVASVQRISHEGAGAELDVEELRATLDRQGVAHDIEELDQGTDTADQIVGLAGRLDADLVVLGLRRRTPVGKLILGSIAQRVLLDAPCPVLAVKAD